jgi:hypothetical protein
MQREDKTMSLRKFNGKQYQFGGSVSTKKETLRIKKRFLNTKMVKVRITKDKHGYMVWLRPAWMDLPAERRKPESVEFRFKFMSDEFNHFIRSGF